MGLSAWQISRGFEKREAQALYEDPARATEWRDGDEVRPFQRLRVRGAFEPRRQIILDNIIIDSRLGHYVLTPLELGGGVAPLLVNRGWVAKEALASTELAPLPGDLEVRGQAGSLPRAGYKMGESFAASAIWPKHAVYPGLADVEAELGQPVQPFVLLLDPEADGGFFRYWQPNEFGPGKHFGYALQWFAMGGVLAGLLVWNWRKRKPAA